MKPFFFSFLLSSLLFSCSLKENDNKLIKHSVEKLLTTWFLYKNPLKTAKKWPLKHYCQSK